MVIAMVMVVSVITRNAVVEVEASTEWTFPVRGRSLANLSCLFGCVWPATPNPCTITHSTNFRRSVRHTGIDIPAPEGTDILASRAGTVVQRNTTEDRDHGFFIAIDHGVINGIRYFTYYSHMVRASPHVVGTQVARGQVIGGVGTTGDSTGNHLHFEIRKGANNRNNADDPVPYLRNAPVLPPPTVLRVRNPSNGQDIATNNGSIALFTVTSGSSVTFSWGAVAGAINYEFQLMTWNGSAWVEFGSVRSVTGTSTTQTMNSAGSWGFRVRAGNTTGWSAWERWFTFTVLTTTPETTTTIEVTTTPPTTTTDITTTEITTMANCADCGEVVTGNFCANCGASQNTTATVTTTEEITTAPPTTTTTETTTPPTTTTTPPEPAAKPGHVLGNDTIAITDALEVLKHLAGISTLTGDALNAARIITPGIGAPTINDVLEILKYLAGLPSAITQ
jgi:hypothetical protein